MDGSADYIFHYPIFSLLRWDSEFPNNRLEIRSTTLSSEMWRSSQTMTPHSHIRTKWKYRGGSIARRFSRTGKQVSNISSMKTRKRSSSCPQTTSTLPSLFAGQPALSRSNASSISTSSKRRLWLATTTKSCFRRLNFGTCSTICSRPPSTLSLPIRK